MKAKLTLIALVVAVSMALALPAQAKGQGTALVSGPGLVAPLEISGRPTATAPPDFWEFVSQSGIFEDWKSRPPSRVGLGPRYEVMLFFGDEPGTASADGIPDLVHMDLYPYAKDGPWTYAPPGQTGGSVGTVAEGWTAAPASLLDYLIEKGLPERRPRGTRTETGSSLQSEAPIPWTGMAVGASLAVLMLSGALLARRRRLATV